MDCGSTFRNQPAPHCYKPLTRLVVRGRSHNGNKTRYPREREKRRIFLDYRPVAHVMPLRSAAAIRSLIRTACQLWVLVSPERSLKGHQMKQCHLFVRLSVRLADHF
ncbi:hypothetical protein TNCT_344941 [Trichonephila clavata]|uniref:Uncharacterized protein n=1 Tax=Trichonephila clavata TaxID=2740835 RepID=A0A8X6GUZ8_TRICU|nr:hypothetical protein TNCT_344941 [Trichonephila clavata]